MNNDCIFCKIIDNQIPSNTVYEDDDVKAILDVAPANRGHVIVLVKKHVESIFELDEATAAKLFPVVTRIAKAIQKTLQCDGVNILQNNGEAAGQTVHHLHVHIIPRFNNDTVTIHWNGCTYQENEASEFMSQLQNNL